MADFPFFKMAAVRHLGFSKVENFNRRSDSEDKCASSCQISWRSVEPLRRYGQYSIFKMAAVHQLQFLKVGNFKFGSSSEVQYESSCQISRRSVEPFRRSGRFFKMATVRHLWFFYACWFHPRRVFGGLCDCAKFGCNRCSNFDSMQILIFCMWSLKMPIHAPKIEVFGDFTPKMGEVWTRPQKAHPWAETRRMTYRSSKSVHVCGLGASRRIMQKTKKIKKEVYLRNHNTCFCTGSPRPPTLSHRQINLHVCSYSPPGYIFQVSSKSVQRLRNPRRSKFGPSHNFS